MTLQQQPILLLRFTHQQRGVIKDDEMVAITKAHGLRALDESIIFKESERAKKTKFIYLIFNRSTKQGDLKKYRRSDRDMVADTSGIYFQHLPVEPRSRQRPWKSNHMGEETMPQEPPSQLPWAWEQAF